MKETERTPRAALGPAGEAAHARLLKVTGRGLPLAGNDVDTDQIIPARYMKAITFNDLGRYVFQDARFDQEGKPRDHPMNDPAFQGASILLVGKNFGCGSSREHAPQALMRWGIRAVLGESFAEIFAGNCTAMGLPALRLDEDSLAPLLRAVRMKPQTLITVNLETMRVSAEGAGSFPVFLPEADARLLRSGSWDTTGELLVHLPEIEAAASRLPYIRDFPYPAAAQEDGRL
jgi:3-isopropylmalate/(R)-2-methylmalate dehydratase small subunit